MATFQEEIKTAASTKISTQSSTEWNYYQVTALQFFFLYFLLQIFPLDWKFYQQLFSINWLHLSYADIFNLAHYTPDFLGVGQSFGNWIIVAFLAAISTFIWQYLEKSRGKKITDNDTLFYWLRTIVRYRLAIAVFAFGFLKFYSVFSPYPSLSNLNTQYGQYTDWKLFSLSLGIVPAYQSFLGLIEIFAGALLLFRKTASIGAFILTFFIGNIFFSNLAYSGGEYVYSLYLLSLATAVFAFDFLRLYRLVGLQLPTSPNTFKPVFAGKLKTLRIASKAIVIVVFVLYAAQVASAYKNGGYKYPTTKGLSNASGLYNVSSFVVGKDTLAYSLTDSVRWKDVVFEKWATISIRTNKPVVLDTVKIEKVVIGNVLKTYESEESSSRLYYDYTIDSVNHLLHLKNKNLHYVSDSLQLSYSRPSTKTIVLSGINQKGDSIHVILDKVDKKYLLQEAAKEGRRKGIKI
jgi:hypothetical protein